MKIKMYCPKCVDEGIKELETEFYGRFGDDFFSSGFCNNGHQNFGFITRDRYDILLESALISYKLGFDMEATSAFAACLERIQELFIKTRLITITQDLNKMGEFWKQISSQSERQLGTFMAFWYDENKSLWKLNSDMISHRNKVIHKGYLPTGEQTRLYGEYVLSGCNEIIQSLRNNINWKTKDIIASLNDDQEKISGNILVEKSDAFSSTFEFDGNIPIKQHVAVGHIIAILLENKKQTAIRVQQEIKKGTLGIYSIYNKYITRLLEKDWKPLVFSELVARV